MKSKILVAAALGLLLALCGPEAANARPSRHREHRGPVFVTSHRRHPVRVPVVVPWHLRHRREFGWAYGLHGGYHWAPGFGWHNLLHRGQYRVDDARVFVPAHERDWRFRGRF